MIHVKKQNSILLKYPSPTTLLSLPEATALLNLSVYHSQAYLYSFIAYVCICKQYPTSLSTLTFIFNTLPRLLKVTNDLGASKFKGYFHVLILPVLTAVLQSYFLLHSFLYFYSLVFLIPSNRPNLTSFAPPLPSLKMLVCPMAP